MVRCVMAVLALVIFPGLLAGQEPVQATARATLEEVVRFDFDEATITGEAEQLLRAKLPILRDSAAFRLLLEGHADERGSIETTSRLVAGVPRACGTSSWASGFRRIGSRRPRSGRNGPWSTGATRRPGLRTVGSSS